MPTDAQQIYEEGILIPPTKIYNKGVLNAEILKLILHNCRVPQWNEADLMALIAGCRIAGVRADTFEIDFSPSGAATATVGLIGQGSTRSATSSAVTPTTRAYTAFNKAQGAIKRNGSGLAQITGGSLSFANGIEVVRTIRNDLRIEGADPGLARATGQVTSRFADTLLIDDATGNAAIELEFEYRISDARRLTVTLHEAYLALAKTPIQGPAGVQATFDLRAAYNAAAGCMMTVTLRNGVASYG